MYFVKTPITHAVVTAAAAHRPGPAQPTAAEGPALPAVCATATRTERRVHEVHNAIAVSSARQVAKFRAARPKQRPGAKAG